MANLPLIVFDSGAATMPPHPGVPAALRKLALPVGPQPDKLIRRSA